MELLTKLASIKYQLLAVVIAAITLFFGAYTWHQSKVDIAVNEAVIETQRNADKANLEAEKKLKDEAKKENDKLKERIGVLESNAKKQTIAADNKYNALRQWVYKLPTYTASKSGISIDTNNAESRPSDLVGGLSRASAEDIARLGANAEKLKIGLNQCYAQYDEVERTLYEFKQKFE